MLLINAMKKTNLIKSNITPWTLLTVILTAVIFILSIRWSLIDNSPPAWDQGHYLYQASFLHKVIIDSGFLNFLKELFNIDPGRVPLMLLVVQPAFYFFGATLDAAVISINFIWFLLAWSIIGITRETCVKGDAAKAAFFTLLLLGLYPLTIMLSHNFLVEFLLVSFVCASIYSIVMLTKLLSCKWSMLTGLFLGLGLLTKVTFVVFVFPGLLVSSVFIAKKISGKKNLQLFIPGFTVATLIAGPYYFYNIKNILSLTTHLSSKNLAKMYGFGDVFDISTMLTYWSSVFLAPVFVIMFFLLLTTVIYIIFEKKSNLISPNRYYILIFLIWFLVPFVLATFGEIKDPRYLYPGLVPLFIISGLIVARFEHLWISRMMLIVIFILAFPGYLYSNGFLSANSLAKIAFTPGMAVASAADLPPDERDWHIDKLVQGMMQSLKITDGNAKIFFLGGNRYYHLRLLDYEGLRNGATFKYQTLPYYSEVNMTSARALEFIEHSDALGIIYKSGKNWPEFSSRLDSQIVDILKKSPKYIQHDLDIEQPDGSRFILFQSKSFLLTSIHSSADVVGDWKVNGGVAKIAAGKVNSILIKTETGSEGFGVLQDGSIYVKDWGVSGKLTADAELIRWSNGSVWRRASSM